MFSFKDLQHNVLPKSVQLFWRYKMMQDETVFISKYVQLKKDVYRTYNVFNSSLQILFKTFFILINI
jgi:hypothetical protein